MTEPEVPSEEFAKWRTFAQEKQSIAAMLRQAMEVHGIEAHRAGWVAADIYAKKITLDDMQQIWKWKIGGRDSGFSDEEIDVLLSHLLQDGGA